MNKNKYYTKKEKYYIIYKYNEYNNDLQYIKEYNNIADIKHDFKIQNINDYIIKDIDKIHNITDIKHLLQNKYIIIKDV